MYVVPRMAAFADCRDYACLVSFGGSFECPSLLWGFMDQVMALEWVQENVAAFGGDPTKVTLYGQSAGASSIGLHMISPYSQGTYKTIGNQKYL